MTLEQERMMHCFREWEQSRQAPMENESMRLNADIDELVNRYKPVVRDVLIVLTNPDTPERIAGVIADETQFETRELLNRLNTKNLETVEKFLPLLLAFETLDLLVPVSGAGNC